MTIRSIKLNKNNEISGIQEITQSQWNQTLPLPKTTQDDTINLDSQHDTEKKLDQTETQLQDYFKSEQDQTAPRMADYILRLDKELLQRDSDEHSLIAYRCQSLLKRDKLRDQLVEPADFAEEVENDHFHDQSSLAALEMFDEQIELT